MRQILSPLLHISHAGYISVFLLRLRRDRELEYTTTEYSVRADEGRRQDKYLHMGAVADPGEGRLPPVGWSDKIVFTNFQQNIKLTRLFPAFTDS